MLVVGLTGGIATGKSAVSSIIKAHDVPLIDADILARRVVLPGTRAHSQIIFTFGSSILLPDGAIDRAKLGSEIFNDKAKREKLNAIVHPAVRRAIIWDIVMFWLKGEKLCVVDVPLLIEAGLWKWVGKVVVVYCSEELQLQRLMSRDKSSIDAASSRMKSQLPVSEKIKYADHVVDNSGSFKDLEQQVDALLRQLESEVRLTWRLSWILPPFGVGLALWTLLWRFARRKSPRARLHKQWI